MAAPDAPFRLPTYTPARRRLPAGFQLVTAVPFQAPGPGQRRRLQLVPAVPLPPFVPELAATDLPETVVVPPPVSSGDIITAAHENVVTEALHDLWVDVQYLAAQEEEPAVASVFGRIGAVVANAGDYTAEQVTGAVSAAQTYADPAWITSFGWSKITDAPGAFPPVAHIHDAVDIASGVFSAARLGTGTANAAMYLRGDGIWATMPTTMPPAAHFHDASDIASGQMAVARLGGGEATADVYLRGDGLWAALPVAAPVVASVFGRTGAVVAVAGDYAAAQITNAVDASQTYDDPAWLVGIDWSKVSGEPDAFPPLAHTHDTAETVSGVFSTARLGAGAPTAEMYLRGDGAWAALPAVSSDVSSVFGRAGAVVAQAGDYTAAQVTGAVSALESYEDPAWIASINWSKISAAPATFPPAAHTHDASDTISGVFTVARLGSGAADATVFLRGDGTWAVPPAGSGGGSQTPWTSHIDAAGYELRNAGRIKTNGFYSSPSDLNYEWWFGNGFTAADGRWDLVRRNVAGEPWTNPLTVLTNGNVGIGSTAPTHRLTVRPVADVNLAVGSQVNVPGALVLNAINDANTLNIPLEVRATITSFPFGNVGIGAIAPSSRLTIKQSANDYTGGLTLEAAADPNLWRVWLDAGYGLSTGINGGTQMRLMPAGELRLGPTSSGPTQEGSIVISKATAGPNRQFKIGIDAAYALYIGDYGLAGADGPLQKWLTIDYNTGNVGIKKTPGTVALDVAGAAVFANFITVGQHINTVADVNTDPPSHVAMQINGDNWIRWQTLAQFKTHLGAGGSQTPWTQNINAANYWLIDCGKLQSVHYQGTVGASYDRAAIEVREANMALAADGSANYAPRITFHWGNRAASQIGIDGGGVIRTYDLAGTSFEDFACAHAKFHSKANILDPTSLYQLYCGEQSFNPGYHLKLGFMATPSWKGSIQAVAASAGAQLCLNPNGGAVTVGSYADNPASRFIVCAPELGNNVAWNGIGAFCITTGTGVAADRSILMGMHNTQGGWIQSIKGPPGTTPLPLTLNPQGGNVIMPYPVAVPTLQNGQWALWFDQSVYQIKITVNWQGGYRTGALQT